jgi:DNA-binding XRE family transcriptional regulator
MPNKVKGYRVMCGLTQQEMAASLDMSLRSYIAKESGKSEFSISDYKAMKLLFNSKGFDLTIDDLV